MPILSIAVYLPRKGPQREWGYPDIPHQLRGLVGQNRARGENGGQVRCPHSSWARLSIFPTATGEFPLWMAMLAMPLALAGDVRMCGTVRSVSSPMPADTVPA